YELSSGKKLHNVELSSLLPDGGHLANAIAIDPAGNAYVTDSLSPIIYKVDTNGNASIFLRSEHFEGKGINLNGILYHPDGYLITVKKNTGTMFKVPLDKPEAFETIDLSEQIKASDGLVLLDKNSLALIANSDSNGMFLVKTTDAWVTATVTLKKSFPDDYVTTGTIADGGLYVLHSNLNKLKIDPKTNDVTVRAPATIEKVATLMP
ncbi:MAG: hypothetical protein JKY57_01080, partial [Kordiimonadaceae bacterium]|nr:hypothetical protein [Kordiimonadaceae bacterium]